MEMIFKPVFTWTPQIDEKEDFLIWFTKSKYEDLYVSVHNLFADLANPHYEEWNEEWSEIANGKDGYDPAYNEFINRKCDFIIETLNYNLKLMNDKFVTGALHEIKVKLGEEHNLLLVINDKYELDMSMIPLE